MKLACGLFGLLCAAFPAPWPQATPAEVGMNEALLRQARDYVLKGGGSGIVIYRGKLVFSWGDLKVKYDLKSTTKSIGATMLGLALPDGKIRLEDKAVKYLPEFGVPPESNRATGWLEEITLLHLATQTAGFDKRGDFQPLLFRPGTSWSYSDGGPNWLADCLTVAYGRDLEQVLFERVFTRLGITREDLHWRANQYRPRTIAGVERREFGSGVHANVDAMARIGFLYLRAGGAGGAQILDPGFVAMARAPVGRFQGVPVLKNDTYPDASRHYGLLWWNNADGHIPGAPRDMYWSWGLYDSWILVVPSMDLVVSRAGKSVGDASDRSRLRPFIEPIIASIPVEAVTMRPPYPPSPVVESVEWGPVDTIRRAAQGCDNWPLTWADDGDLYGACGDGTGFAPFRPKKLGLALARITGLPEAFQGVNIVSDAENTGMGDRGAKASGMLMVDGVLYMWVRNAGNSQLGWSQDHGKTWRWADWKFTVSFGHPAFVNFGRNYAGARDQYVYIYSMDHDSAYEPTTNLVLARAPKNRMRERAAWEFLERVDGAGNPVWTKDVARRGPVFVHAPNRCYRTQVSYNAGLKRYFLYQPVPGETNTRFQGGFGLYDAPEPWGPWTTVYFTKLWDVAPGENGNFPTKWMSPDGKTMHLVFSGDDAFSVRKATLKLRSGGIMRP
jgi:CubicO group peptidase (beta-lactamase class C family)